MSRLSHFVAAPTVQRGDIAALYRSRETDPLWTALNGTYMPPAVFEHGRETLVAQIEARNQDGGDVRVFETRAPAAFYAIEARGFRLSTGSGQRAALLVEAIAFDLASGMLVVEALPQPEGEG